MPRRRSRGSDDALNPWPGFVDALSTLLMVIIFVLLVFVLAQAFLSVALTGRDRALDRLNRQVAELTDMLNLERGRAGELQLSVASLNRDVAAATQARDAQARDLAALRDDQARIAADRDALRAQRDRLAARLADAAVQAQSAQARTEQLQARLTGLAGRVDTAGQDAAGLAAQLADARRQLAQSQGLVTQQTAQLAQLQARLDQANTQVAQLQASGTRLQAQITDAQAQLARQQTLLADQVARLAQQRLQLQQVQAELQRTVTADRATIEAKLADLVRLQDQVTALTALRDDLERQAREAATRAATDAERNQAATAQLAEAQRLGESAQAQVALLNQQMAQLRLQVAQVAAALDLAQGAGRDKDAQIANLGTRLNAALASKVEELQRYRSEFFGRLRDVLANRPGIAVVGDRFVFQSEVLFPAGSADLTQAGQDEMRQLAATLKALARDIPPDVNWLLRVDGHADRQPLGGGAFASNWELSSQRAINVVKRLVAEGVPPERLAATGFGEFQPLDGSDSPAAYARNRRIEIRLTDR